MSILLLTLTLFFNKPEVQITPTLDTTIQIEVKRETPRKEHSLLKKIRDKRYNKNHNIPNKKDVPKKVGVC